jgi:hypothetical protein
MVAAFAASVACSGASAPVDPASDPIVGVWALQTWNGKPLPAITYGSSIGNNEQIVSERFVVSGDGSFSMTRTYRYMPEGRSELQSGTGTWKKSGNDYVLGSGFVPARISASTLSVQWKGDGLTEWVYTKDR